MSRQQLLFLFAVLLTVNVVIGYGNGNGGYYDGHDDDDSEPAIQLPEQVWNHLGGDVYGLIAPASALWGRKLILTGGSDGIRNHSESWKYDLNNGEDWTVTPESLEDMFHTRSHHTSNVYRDYLFTFGGSKHAKGLEVQQLIDGDEHIVYKGPGPHKRAGHTATLRDEDLYVYGGYDVKTGNYTAELWRANIRYGQLEWELIELEAPCGPRAGHTSILYQDSLYIFGGQNDDGYLNDVWRYDFITEDWIRSYTWKSGDYYPEGRIGHAAVYYSDEAMYIWGGYGEIGFYNDLWKFDLQHEKWIQVFEGNFGGYQSDTYTIPSPRAFSGFTVFESKLIILGGQVTMGGVKELFWSPLTRYVPIEYPDDFAGDVWAYDFCKEEWEFIGCMSPWADYNNFTSPEECRSQFAPVCPNNCSSNGVCVRDGHCICRGEWTGVDCSVNVCFENPYLGYDVELMDRILISESILNVGKQLRRLKDKLESIRDRLPPYEEFTTCVKFNPQIGELVRDQAGTDGLAFDHDLDATFLPIVDEFNQVLKHTHDGQELVVIPY